MQLLMKFGFFCSLLNILTINDEGVAGIGALSEQLAEHFVICVQKFWKVCEFNSHCDGFLIIVDRIIRHLRTQIIELSFNDRFSKVIPWKGCSRMILLYRIPDGVCLFILYHNSANISSIRRTSHKVILQVHFEKISDFLSIKLFVAKYTRTRYY